MIDEFKKEIMKEHKLTDLETMKYFLDVLVKQSTGKIFSSQKKYIKNLLKKFDTNHYLYQ